VRRAPAARIGMRECTAGTCCRLCPCAHQQGSESANGVLCQQDIRKQPLIDRLLGSCMHVLLSIDHAGPPGAG